MKFLQYFKIQIINKLHIYQIFVIYSFSIIIYNNM